MLGFKAGEIQVTYSGVLAIEDSLDEHDETITATVGWHSSMPAAYQATVSAEGTINDDDAEPDLRIIDATSVEGGSPTFIVNLDAPSGKQVTVNYASTATSGTDYTAVSDTLTFEPGQTTTTIAIPTTFDSTVEPDETFTVQLLTQDLSDPNNPLETLNATISPTNHTATGTITNDDT